VNQVEVLDRALISFWRLGYEGCSIADLVQTTGAPRQSLYNAFVDKQGLFLAVLKRYGALLAESLISLRRPEAELPELRNYMENVLAGQAARGVGGCLLVQTSFGPGVQDPQVRRVVEGGASAVRSCFADVIRRAVACGRLPSHVNPNSTADYLYALLNGLSALARSGAKKAELSSVLAHAFATIGIPQLDT
jgi:TetR/AcrR family transcriptional regulator, transcriptional repressor for nem operon